MKARLAALAEEEAGLVLLCNEAGSACVAVGGLESEGGARRHVDGLLVGGHLRGGEYSEVSRPLIPVTRSPPFPSRYKQNLLLTSRREKMFSRKGIFLLMAQIKAHMQRHSAWWDRVGVGQQLAEGSVAASGAALVHEIPIWPLDVAAVAHGEVHGSADVHSGTDNGQARRTGYVGTR